MIAGEIKTSEGLIVLSQEPLNLEMPFSSLEGFITPNERFYVRCHFPIPQIDRKTWRLKVEGAVSNSLELSYDELSQMEMRTVLATMECAGNGRSLLETKVKGTQWDLGAVGNAEWTGVPLSAVLQRAGIGQRATDVILEGADRGGVKEPPRPEGEIYFARSVPIEKAKHDVLLAFKMNGEELTPSHGFPLRAIVPGWYGMASVKWLQRIVVTDEPFNGYYQSADYAYWQRRDGLPTLVPLSVMPAKAQIARPQAGEEVAAGKKYSIRGAAWSGGPEVIRVEISSDRGTNWASANLVGESRKNAWRFWELEWEAPAKPGKYNIMARATDAAGHSQPLVRDLDHGTYMIDHCLPIEITVR